MIRKEYARPEIAALKPASALASIMGRDAAKSRISLYGSGDQSVLTEILAFVADGDEVAIVQRLPRVLGTWLRLSILRFPGVLVNDTAAASLLNIARHDFSRAEIRNHFSDASYQGPFSGLANWWWRDDLECLLLDAGESDGRSYLGSMNVSVDPCQDDETGERAGYYCMITETPVSHANSRGNINWFPSGADLARIRISKFDQITSLVGT